MLKVLILSNKDMTSNIIFSGLFGSKSLNICGVAFTDTLTKRKSGLLGVLALAKKMSIRYWLFLIFTNVLFIVRTRLTKVRKYRFSLAAKCKANMTPCVSSSDFNSPEFLRFVQHLKPDIIVLRVDQIIGSELLSIPIHGIWCIHSSLLPNYKGIAGEFHAMRCGEQRIGSSVFKVKLELDEGELIKQESMESSSSLLVNIIENNLIGARILKESLCDLALNGDVSEMNMRPGRGSYYSWPSRENVNAFKSLKLKLIGRRGLLRFLSVLS